MNQQFYGVMSLLFSLKNAGIKHTGIKHLAQDSRAELKPRQSDSRRTTFNTILGYRSQPRS